MYKKIILQANSSILKNLILMKIWFDLIDFDNKTFAIDCK